MVSKKLMARSILIPVVLILALSTMAGWAIAACVCSCGNETVALQWCQEASLNVVCNGGATACVWTANPKGKTCCSEDCLIEIVWFGAACNGIKAYPATCAEWAETLLQCYIPCSGSMRAQYVHVDFRNCSDQLTGTRSRGCECNDDSAGPQGGLSSVPET